VAAGRAGPGAGGRARRARRSGRRAVGVGRVSAGDQHQGPDRRLDAPALPTTLARRVADLGATPLPVTVEHGLLAGSLRWDHRDPFDRVLVAQATVEELVLVTVDAAITRLPVPRVLTW
jgi:PIN domain nuclease of toxin-antitoxin system